MTDRASVAEAAEATVAAFGAVHVLCNNAGSPAGEPLRTRASQTGIGRWPSTSVGVKRGQDSCADPGMAAVATSSTRRRLQESLPCVRRGRVHDSEVRGAGSQRITSSQPRDARALACRCCARAHPHTHPRCTDREDPTPSPCHEGDPMRCSTRGRCDDPIEVGRPSSWDSGEPSLHPLHGEFATRSNRYSTRSSTHSRPIRRCRKRVLRSNAAGASSAMVCAALRHRLTGLASRGGMSCNGRAFNAAARSADAPGRRVVSPV